MTPELEGTELPMTPAQELEEQAGEIRALREHIQQKDEIIQRLTERLREAHEEIEHLRQCLIEAGPQFEMTNAGIIREEEK